MLLKCARTSSEGNSFAIETDKSILLIEAGVVLPEIKKMIDFQIDKVAGAIISHEHT